MDLKTHCIKNLVEIINNLPPLLHDEVIGESVKAIKKQAKEDAKKEVMKEIKRSATIVVEDVTERLIRASRDGTTWSRPEYTNDIDDELYYTFVDVSERFVHKHGEQLIFNQLHRPRQQRTRAIDWNSESNYDSNEYDSD